MNNPNFTTIDPTQANIPEAAVVQKVHSENDRLPNGEHDKAVKAFLVSDGIASGIGKDLAFVDKIPQFINEIIDNKSWECLYVAKGVMTPYYCRYIKATDSENFQAFITAKRPNGLETSVETLDRVLQADLEVQRRFRTTIYESRQGERTDLIGETSTGNQSKLSRQQQTAIRAANRASVAVPIIGELLDRGLIAIDVAALLGRDIKNLEDLTAEEREYVDKRDLIGLRLDQYIYTNPIPDDEDKEPAYSRELNSFIKDLLGIKNRSNTVRMDHPKKAAEKLLQFYEGERLQELVNYLRQGLELSSKLLPVLPQSDRSTNGTSEPSPAGGTTSQEDVAHFTQLEMNSKKLDTKELNTTKLPHQDLAEPETLQAYELKSLPPETSAGEKDSSSDSSTFTTTAVDNLPDLKPTDANNFALVTPTPENLKLTVNELAERLGVKPSTVSDASNRRPHQFLQWTRKKDPEGIAWQRIEEKEGVLGYLLPFQKTLHLHLSQAQVREMSVHSLNFKDCVTVKRRSQLPGIFSCCLSQNLMLGVVVLTYLNRPKL